MFRDSLLLRRPGQSDAVPYCIPHKAALLDHLHTHTFCLSSVHLRHNFATNNTSDKNVNSLCVCRPIENEINVLISSVLH